LDTDILIDVQRGHGPAVAWFESLVELPVISGFAVMELIQDAPNVRHVQKSLRLVTPFSVVWPNEADCQRALENFAGLHLSQGLGRLDALIAACAVGRSLTLCTFNVKHYAAVPKIRLLQPYAR
jgi:predicted nucleic acid-binding protein